MSEIWKPLSIETYGHWIDVIQSESSDSLTDWESDFVESISNRIAGKHNLTERQADILERIYTEKTK